MPRLSSRDQVGNFAVAFWHDAEIRPDPEPVRPSNWEILWIACHINVCSKPSSKQRRLRLLPQLSRACWPLLPNPRPPRRTARRLGGTTLLQTTWQLSAMSASCALTHAITTPLQRNSVIVRSRSPPNPDQSLSTKPLPRQPQPRRRQTHETRSFKHSLSKGGHMRSANNA